LTSIFNKDAKRNLIYSSLATIDTAGRTTSEAISPAPSAALTPTTAMTYDSENQLTSYNTQTARNHLATAAGSCLQQHCEQLLAALAASKASMPKKPSQWRSSLLNHLREANPPTRLAALKWLCNHMDDYLDRFIGFVQMATLPTETILKGDLFVIVQVTMDIINEHLLKDPPIHGPIRISWNEFQNSIVWMEKAQDPADIPLIQQTYATFKSTLTTLHE
jgi:hypothetical protein